MTKKLILVALIIIAGHYSNAQKKKIETLPERSINVDINQVKGPLCKTFKECIGAGRANEGLRADWQQQLAMIQKEIGFKYIRMHGLLCDDMGVYKEDKMGNPSYNFQYIDQLYDYLLSINIKPFVELAFMPKDLASGSQTIFWWNGNITPPKSYEKWSGLIQVLVSHFKERYGNEEVKTWYFEVWNEPDLVGIFFSKEIDEYFKLYKVTAEAVKSVSSEYRIGGPASAMGQYDEKLIKYCVENKVPLDFIATHAYGVDQGFVDATGNRGTRLNPNKTAVRDRMVKSREMIKNSPMPNLELHYTEWSSSYTPTDYIHDTYQQAPYILDKIKGAQESVNSLSYWVFTDIFEENGPRFTPFHGGFGLINYQGIKKPAYYAYYFLNKLGNNELVNNDAESWVCKNENGDVQALFWDFNPVAPPDSMNNQVYYKGELPSKDKSLVKLKLTSLKDGKYLLKVYKTGYHINDALTAYINLGSPAQLTRKNECTLKQLSDGSAVEKEMITVVNGTFDKEVKLRDNDVVLVTLTKTE
jgi:xylan 1,4-beta-xylosidase